MTETIEEEECRRSNGVVGEGRKKTESRGEEKLLNPFLKLLKIIRYKSNLLHH